IRAGPAARPCGGGSARRSVAPAHKGPAPEPIQRSPAGRSCGADRRVWRRTRARWPRYAISRAADRAPPGLLLPGRAPCGVGAEMVEFGAVLALDGLDTQFLAPPIGLRPVSFSRVQRRKALKR